MNPTPEQISARDLFASGESLAIEAGAGTGKTSTLKLLAESTDRRGQYIAFNKAIVVEAGEKMPGTVNCSTAHSLAFRSVGKRYAHRLNSPRMKSLDIANRLGIDPLAITSFDNSRKVLARGYLAGLVMRSVTRFCQTADEEPTWRHVPWVEGIDAPRGERNGSRENNTAVAKWIEPAIKRAWRDLLDPTGSLPYRHDHYLKAFQLDNPRIGADYILFDEAQDANPVMVAIVAAQHHAQLVWVGDSQQQIYSFTGAVNALAGVPADHRTFLTQSFRFGPAIADVANRVLGMLPDAELRLLGTDTIDSVVGPVAEPDVILTRTNATAVRAVLGAQKAGTRVHLVGGGSEIVAFARAAERLMNGEQVEHPDLACFESWNEVRDYVNQDAQGADLRLMTKLVDDFGVPTILEALDHMTPEARATLIVSTAHKAKGREWNAVKLADDFPEQATGDEELRLLYVAVTRARRELDITAVTLLDPDHAPATADAAGAAAAAGNGSVPLPLIDRMAEAMNAVLGAKPPRDEDLRVLADVLADYEADRSAS
jgi:hypothetical protein